MSSKYLVVIDQYRTERHDVAHFILAPSGHLVLENPVGHVEAVYSPAAWAYVCKDTSECCGVTLSGGESDD